ncbi:phosphoesterase [Gordonia phage GMA2]|uniref:Calcineurin-like phosphoesterase domain-containing protein n=1 Tax=Gordonia phage GMA2 TaxID=1647283 RepID=A0A0K0N798_9CAUD|nr:phosphoesterase [Gordonia phage GMA2]AKJ72617.1 hypothetical protein GMA2_79 [Gordonia phage GMA2]
MSEAFYIADLHLAHEKLAEYRGFNSAAEHDEMILDQIDSLPDGPLWILGDICSGSKGSTERALDMLRSNLGARQVHLITGNHDLAWPWFRDSYKWQKKFMDVFDSVQPFARRKISGQSVMLSHFPYEGDHLAVDRHPDARLRLSSMPLIHGHTHSSDKLSHVMRTDWDDDRGVRVTLDVPQICVSWEAWKRPVAQYEIEEMLSSFEPWKSDELSKELREMLNND